MVEDVRGRGARRSPAPTRSSAAARRSPSTPRMASAHDNLVIIPVVLLVVFLILMLLLRALVAPLLLIGDRGAVLRGRAGPLVADVQYVFGFAGAPTRRSRSSRSCSWWRWASTTTSS